MFAGQGLSLVFQVGYFIILARLLGTLQYGIYVGAVALVAILSQYSSLGSGQVFLRYVCRNHQLFSRYWGNILMATTTLGILFVGVIALTGPHLAHSYSRGMLVCVAVGDCLCAQLTLACARVFQAFEQTRMMATLNLITNGLRATLAGVLLLALHKLSASQWVVASLIVSAAAVIIAVILVTRKFGNPEFSVRLLRETAGEGFVFALTTSTSGLYNNIDKAMLGHYGMNLANGIYTMAYRVVDIGTYPTYSIHAAAFPRFFRKGADGTRETAKYARKILRGTSPLELIVVLAMFLFAPILPKILGHGFRDSVNALRWLCLLPFFRTFQFSAGDALTTSGRQSLRLGTQTLAAAFNFGVNLYLIPRYSWRGAAWSSLATDGGLAILNWIVLAFCLALDRRRVVKVKSA